MILTDGRRAPIAPQAFAETAPLFYNGVFVPDAGIKLATQFATYAALYKVQPWVFTVVDKIANLIARLGVQVWDTAPDTGNVLDKTGPYASLIADPCDTLDPFSFWLWLTTTIEIYGEAFLLKLRGGTGKTVKLLPMHPAMVTIHRDETGALLYRFTGSPNELIPEQDVVPFRRFNPDNTMRGLSRLEPLRSTLMNEDSARRATAAWWDNMGRPSMVLSTEKKLGQEGKERLKTAFQATQAGAGKAGGTLVLEDGVTATQMQLSAEEMQYIESRKLNREEVCAVYDIPPPAVGILDHATFSNITEQFRSVYRDSISFRIEFIESVLNWYVGREFNGQKQAKFCVADVLRGDFEKRAPAAVQLVQSGIMKPSEARPMFDLDDAGPIADKLYANSAIQELGKPAERMTIAASESSGETPDQVPVDNLPASQKPSPQAQKYMRDIAGQIGRGKSLQEAAKALVDAHPGDMDAIREACEHIIERQR